MSKLQPMIRAALSKRQTVVAELLVLGFKQTEIARALGISERTVKQHIMNMFRLAEIPPNWGHNSQILLCRALLCK